MARTPATRSLAAQGGRDGWCLGEGGGDLCGPSCVLRGWYQRRLAQPRKDAALPRGASRLRLAEGVRMPRDSDGTPAASFREAAGRRVSDSRYLDMAPAHPPLGASPAPLFCATQEKFLQQIGSPQCPALRVYQGLSQCTGRGS